MNNRTKRLLSMVVAIAMMITSLNVPTLADGLWVGSDDVISGASISISNYSTNPISEETVFAPDLDPDVSTYGTPAAVTGFYQINDIALLGSEERPASIDAGWYSYEDGESFEYAARTLGASSDQGGFITFAVESAAKVTVYATPTGSGRAIGIISGVPSGEVTEDDFEDYQYDDSVQSNIYDFNAVTPGQYSIAATSGYDISKVVVTPIDDDEVIITANAEQVASANAITENATLSEGTYTINDKKKLINSSGDEVATDGTAGIYISGTLQSEYVKVTKTTSSSKAWISVAPSVTGTMSVAVSSSKDNGIAVYEGDGVTEGTTVSVTSPSSYNYSFAVSEGQSYTIWGNGDTYVQSLTLTSSSSATTITPDIISENGTAVLTNSTGSTVTTVTPGSSYTLTVTPDEGYNVDSVTYNSSAVTANTDGTYTITIGDEDESAAIEVTYAAAAQITPSVTYTDSDNTEGLTGTITYTNSSSEAVTSLTAGHSYTLAVTPADGYTVSTVEATGATVTSDEDGYTITVDSSATAETTIAITVTYTAASSGGETPSTSSGKVWDFSSNATLQAWAGTSEKPTLSSGDGLTFGSEGTGDAIKTTSNNTEIEGISTFTYYFETGGNGGSSKRVFTIQNASAGDTVTIYCGANGSKTMTIGNGSVTSLATADTSARGTVSTTPLTYTVANDGDTTFYFNGQVGIYYISIASSGSTATTSNAVITIVNEVSSTLTDLTGLTITATPESGSSKEGTAPAADETTGTITSTIEGLIVGTAYDLAVSGLSAVYKAVFYPTSLTISETEDNTATLTISDADKVIYTFTLSDESATVTLTNTADSTDTYTVDSTNNTANLVAGATYRVTVSSGYTVSSIEADDSTTVDGSTITASTETTGTATITVAEEEAVEFKQVLDPSQATDQTLASDDEILINNYFKISAGSIDSSYPSINNSSTGKTVTLADTNYTYTKGYVDTSGASDGTKRYISFTPTSLGTIYVYGIANSGSDERTVYMVYTDGTAVEGSAKLPTNSATAAQEVTFTITSEGLNKEHKIYVSGGGAKIYYIGSTAELATLSTTEETVTPTVTITGGAEDTAVTIGETSVTSGSTATLTVGEEYTVTVPDGYTISSITLDDGTVDGATITPTSSTTSIEIALTEDSSGSETGYAEMGTYVIGSGATGGNYNITTDGTYGNVTFDTKDSTTMADSGIKMRKNDGTITFTVESDTILVVTSSGQAAILIAADGTETTLTSGTEYTLSAGASYTITGSNTSGNTYVSKMVLKLAGETEEDTYFTITGTVTDSDGNPVSGITVILDNGTDTTTTNENGVYTFENVAAGAAHTVQTNSDTYATASATVSTSEAVEGAEVTKDMTVIYAGSVTVNVTLDGDTYANATVILSSTDDTYRGTTNSSGSVTITDVVPGDYTVIVSGYDTQTSSVTVGSSAVTVAMELETLDSQDITITATNNSSAARTVTLTNSDGEVAATFTVPADGLTPTGSDDDTVISLTPGSYTATATGAAISPAVVSVTATTTELSFAISAAEELTVLTALSANTTYTFNSSNINDTNDNFYFETVSNTDKSFNAQSSAVKIPAGHFVQFELNETTIVEITYNSNDLLLQVYDEATSTWVDYGNYAQSDKTTGDLTLPAGRYRVSLYPQTETSSNGVGLKTIVTKEVDETSASLTLTVNNKDSLGLSVSVDGGTAQAVASTESTKDLTFTGLGTGTHTVTITADNGSTIDYDLTSVTVAKDDTTVTATVNVTKSTTVKLTFVQDITTNSPSSISNTVTVSGANSGTVDKKGNKLTFDAKPGETYYFTSKSTSITQITKNTAMTNDGVKIYFDQSSNRKFLITIPDADNMTNGLSEGYVITFVNTDNYLKTSDDKTEGSSTSDMTYGQYGFGADKVTLCGNNGRTAFEYQGCYASMYDFAQGYSDVKTGYFADAILDGADDHGFALITSSDATYIKITTSGDIVDGTMMKIDAATPGSSSDTDRVAVYDANGEKMTYTESGSKYVYKINHGTTYTIKGTSDSMYTYIKSIRTYNPNNIFTPNLTGRDASIAATRYLTTESGITGDLADAFNLSDASSDKAVIRLITEIAPSAAADGVVGALATILSSDYSAFGWKVMPADAVNAYNDEMTKESNVYYTPGVNDMTEGVNDTLKKKLEEWGDYTTNEFSVSDIVNTGVGKMGIDTTDGTGYDDAKPFTSTAAITAADLLVGESDATNPEKTFSKAYAQQFVSLGEGKYYLYPFTIYADDTSTKVYNQYDESDTTSNNWLENMNVLSVEVDSNGNATVGQSVLTTTD